MTKDEAIKELQETIQAMMSVSGLMALGLIRSKAQGHQNAWIEEFCNRYTAAMHEALSTLERTQNLDP